MLQVVVLLLQLLPAACCRLPSFVCCPSAANVTACLASTRHTHTAHTHTHTHVCSSAPKMGQLNVSRFPETKAMPFNFGLSLATLPYSVCPAAVCLMDASFPSKPAPSCAQLTKKRGVAAAHKAAAAQLGRMERRNFACSACSFVRSAKNGKDRLLLFVTVIQETI